MRKKKSVIHQRRSLIYFITAPVFPLHLFIFTVFRPSNINLDVPSITTAWQYDQQCFTVSNCSERRAVPSEEAAD